MERTCLNCGAALTESDGICRNCGASAGIMEKGRKKKKQIICGLVAAVAALGILLSGHSTNRSSGGGGSLTMKQTYKEPIENVVCVFIEGNGGDKLEHLAPEEYWEYQREENGIYLSDVEREYELEKDNLRADTAREYGDDFETRCKVNSVGTVPAREEKIIRDALWEQYAIEGSRITDMKKLDAQVTISGSENEETIQIEPIIVEIGNRWYWVNWDSCGDGYIVWFAGLD